MSHSEEGEDLTQTHRRVYGEGCDAYGARARRYDNPYPPSDIKNRWWDAGWMEAWSEDNPEEE